MRVGGVRLMTQHHRVAAAAARRRRDHMVARLEARIADDAGVVITNADGDQQAHSDDSSTGKNTAAAREVGFRGVGHRGEDSAIHAANDVEPFDNVLMACGPEDSRSRG